MATGIGQQLKGMMQKARHYWAELTDDEATRARHRREEQDDAMHQRFGGVPTRGGRDTEDTAKAYRDRQESSQDRGRSDAELANPAVRAARGEGSQRGGEPTGSQQMQGPQAERQYTQQGGSGSQRTLAEQEAGGTSATDTGRRQQGRPPAGGPQRH